MTDQPAPTVTVGWLRDYLERFDADTPITVATPEGAWWLNIIGATDPAETEEPSIVLLTSDNFSTRQW